MKRAVRNATEPTSSFDSFSAFLNNFWAFCVDYQIELLVVFSLLAGTIYFWKYHRKKAASIHKLWVFTLFFLTKRQMMIPLVISLSEKDGVLPEEVRVQLLEIRNRCRDVSLKKDPIGRLELEQRVSKALFFYFTNLEEKGQIKAGTKFKKIVKDLEFIDAKLVQLQVVYNREAEKWNKTIGSTWLGWCYSIFRFKPFMKFQMPPKT